MPTTRRSADPRHEQAERADPSWKLVAGRFREPPAMVLQVLCVLVAVISARRVPLTMLGAEEERSAPLLAFGHAGRASVRWARRVGTWAGASGRWAGASSGSPPAPPSLTRLDPPPVLGSSRPPASARPGFSGARRLPRSATTRRRTGVQRPAVCRRPRRCRRVASSSTSPRTTSWTGTSWARPSRITVGAQHRRRAWTGTCATEAFGAPPARTQAGADGHAIARTTLLWVADRDADAASWPRG